MDQDGTSTDARTDLEAGPPRRGPEPIATDRGVGAADLRTPEDDAEGAAIDARKKEYAEHDQRVRETLLARPTSMLKRSRIASLNEAADILLRELDPPHADRIREIARENGWEPWVVILGQVVRAADLNELAAGEFSPEWLNRTGRDSAVSATETCLMCGYAIPGARKGQTACCNDHGSGKVDHTEACVLGHVVLFKGQWVDDRRVEIRPA